VGLPVWEPADCLMSGVCFGERRVSELGLVIVFSESRKKKFEIFFSKLHVLLYFRVASVFVEQELEVLGLRCCPKGGAVRSFLSSPFADYRMNAG